MDWLNQDTAKLIGANLSLPDVVACRRVCREYAEWFRTHACIVHTIDGALVYAREHDYEYLYNDFVRANDQKYSLFAFNSVCGACRISAPVSTGLLRWLVRHGINLCMHTNEIFHPTHAHAPRETGLGLVTSTSGGMTITYPSGKTTQFRRYTNEDFVSVAVFNACIETSPCVVHVGATDDIVEALVHGVNGYVTIREVIRRRLRL